MFQATLFDSFEVPPLVTAILSIPSSQKLLVSKDNGDVYVYVRDSGSYKLLQTYSDLLKTSTTGETRISQLLYSEELSTVFARCNKSIILYNGANLQQYDQIVDRRGIVKCWAFDISSFPNNKELTLLVYVTGDSSKLRILKWEGRIYQDIVEIELIGKKGQIVSIHPGIIGLIITTKNDICYWPYTGGPNILKIDNVIKKRYPSDIASLINLLEKSCNKNGQLNSKELPNDTDSVLSTSRLSTKTSFSNFWNRARGRPRVNDLGSTRFVFQSNVSFQPLVLDGLSKKLLKLNVSDSGLPFIEAEDINQFFEWHSEFTHVQKSRSLDLLILSNANSLRLVHCRTGFVFLQVDIAAKIRYVVELENAELLIWTEANEFQFYRYSIDQEEDQDGLLTDTDSICGMDHDHDFFALWKKAEFYKLILNITQPELLWGSSATVNSLKECALKLRDVIVMLALRAYERLSDCVFVARELFNNDAFCIKLREVLIVKIFEIFVKYWAPPELVILKTFPQSISYLIDNITGQKHGCLSHNTNIKIEIIPKDVFIKSCIPYLVDMRRHLGNLLNKAYNGVIKWECYGQSIDEDIDFLLIDSHRSVSAEMLLALVDTALFKCYFYYNRQMIGPLLRVENSCNEDIVVKDLEQAGLLRELIDFYYCKGRHEDALEFLGGLKEKALSGSIDPHLAESINILIIECLRNLPNSSLNVVFKYTDKLLSTVDGQTDVLSAIFLSDNQSFTNRDYEKIYEYLLRHDESLSLRYLEFVIGELKAPDQGLYYTLIQRYLRISDHSSVKAKLTSLLESTHIYNPSSILDLLQSSLESPEIQSDKMRSDYIKFLKIFPLQLLGKHTEAIDILLLELKDNAGISAYCDRVYQGDKVAGSTVLKEVLQRLIAMDETKNGANLVSFLQEHSLQFNLAELCELLPPEMTLRNSKEILVQVLRTQLVTEDENRLLKNVIQAQLVRESCKVTKAISSYTILNTSTKCPVCKRTFPRYMIDSVYLFQLNGKDVITHYSCAKVLQKDTSTGKKEDIRNNQQVLANLRH